MAMRSEGAVGRLRAGLLALLLVGVAGTAVTLAYERHWDGVWQLVPWAVLAAICLSLVALLLRSAPGVIRLARGVAVATIVAAVFGVWRHFDENYATAPLDGRYSERWETMSGLAQWWEVINGSVGHVPVLAAGALVPIGITLALLTVGLDSGTPRR